MCCFSVRTHHGALSGSVRPAHTNNLEEFSCFFVLAFGIFGNPFEASKFRLKSNQKNIDWMLNQKKSHKWIIINILAAETFFQNFKQLQFEANPPDKELTEGLVFEGWFDYYKVEHKIKFVTLILRILTTF